MSYTTQNGEPVRLGALIASKGEGAVYPVLGPGKLAAKIYHTVPPTSKLDKLRAMASLADPGILGQTAWPLYPIYSGDRRLAGFVMPLVEGHKEIHLLYGPASRMSDFPDARWEFLVQVAANVARAFAGLHEKRIVVGDVNQGGILVAQNGTVRVIDCDSFQFEFQGRVFPCEVGVPDFTPPELQGVPFGRVVRSLDHDRFGLAVLVFQLLFLGRHPYAGRMRGTTDLSLTEAIRLHHFAYSLTALNPGLSAPPSTLHLSDLSPRVRDLFERAFSDAAATAGRPTAKEWVDALRDLAGRLRPCAVNDAHRFVPESLHCPWCRLEQSIGGVLLFGFRQNAGAAGLNIDGIWLHIVAVPKPPPDPGLPQPGAARMPASAAAKRLAVRRALVALGGVAVVAVVMLALVVGLIPSAAWFWPTAGSIVVAIGIVSALKGNTNEFKTALNQSKRDWSAAETRWAKQSSTQDFDLLFRELESARQILRNLPQERVERTASLRRDVERRQREAYLSTFTVHDAEITDIGQGRKTTLRSYGVVTARDVTEANVRAIPGFGDHLTWRLLTWRRDHEGRFRFDAARGVPPGDLAQLESELTNKRLRFEQRLRSGASALTTVRADILARREHLRPVLRDALAARRQAEADGRLLLLR